MRNMEATRRIFMMESTDNGDTFGNERIVQPTNNGATAQVPPVATFDAKGRLQLLYRAAGGNAVRSVCRIVSRNKHGSNSLAHSRVPNEHFAREFDDPSSNSK